MSKLFLSSSFANVIDLFSEFMGELRGKKVAFIPTASKVEEVTFYVEAAKNMVDTYSTTLHLIPITNEQAIIMDADLVTIKTKIQG